MPSEAVSWKPVDDSKVEAVELEQRMKELSSKPKEEDAAPSPTATPNAGFEADFSSERRLNQRRSLSDSLSWGRHLPRQQLLYLKLLPHQSPKTPGRDRSRSRKSPERDDQPKKKKKKKKKKRTIEALPSAYFTGFSPSGTRPLPVYDFDSMPDNIEAPGWKKSFLEWSLRDLRRCWHKGERAWVSMHISMYLYATSTEYPVAQPRPLQHVTSRGIRTSPSATAAGHVGQTAEGQIKSLWPAMWAFLLGTGTCHIPVLYSLSGLVLFCGVVSRWRSTVFTCSPSRMLHPSH